MFRTKERYRERYEKRVDNLMNEQGIKKYSLYGEKEEEWLETNEKILQKFEEEVEEEIEKEIEEVKRNPNHWKNRVLKYGVTTPLNEDERTELDIAVAYYDNFDKSWLYPYRRYDGSNKFVMRDYYETTDYYKNEAFKLGIYREDFEYNVHFWYWVNRYQNIDRKDFWSLADTYNNIDKVDIIDKQEREVFYIQVLDEFHYAQIGKRLEELKLTQKQSIEEFEEEEERKWRENLEAFYQGGGHEEIIDIDKWDSPAQYIQDTGDYPDSYDENAIREYEYEYKTDERGYTQERKDLILSLVRLHNLIPFDHEIGYTKTEMDHLSNKEDVAGYYRYKAYLKYILKEVPKSWRFE